MRLPEPRCQASNASGEANSGAYGLRLRGVEDASELLVPSGRAWPELHLSHRLGEGAIDAERVTADHAELRLRTGGRIDIDRVAGVAVFTTARVLRPHEVVHPFLAPAAAIVARWLGRESLHAGAFVGTDGAWALLGERETGKSSTLAWLARAGCDIVCDDMLILDGGSAHFGPRSVDLRKETAERLGAGEELGLTGARERWRLQVGPGATEPVPLAGCIFLEWGERVELVDLSGSERVERLFVHRGLRLPPTDPEAMLDVAARPGYELRRPRGWDGLDDAVELLLERFGA